MKRVLTILMVLSLPLTLMAQINVTGTVTDAGTGDPLVGANVVVEGTLLGAAADTDGAFTIVGVPEGSTLTATMIGYASQSLAAAGKVTFALESTAIELTALEVMASRATRNTPVAYSNIDKEDMELRLGSQDIPMALNVTPSVYATQQGGGAGDARINIRGFNQRNVAVMINGVPQNDMENGWVYWSNWDGVGDATSSIQVQRGLSAVNLATPSIGGTMNIITDPTGLKRGGKFKQEIGAGGFLKSTINYNTGLIGDKMAFSATIVRKTGDGVVDKTWTDAWAYYFGASYALNAKNRFELYAIGAPQRHGQSLYKQNIAAYDPEFAETLDFYDSAAIGGKFADVGRYFNQNWSPVSSDYKGKQYWYMYGARTTERHDPDFLNERENFFHKPLVNLNWFKTFNDQMRLSTIFYWSGGSGGGTGTYGSIYTMDADGNLGDDDYKYYYGRSPWTRDWNATIAMNQADAGTFYVDKSAKVKDDQESVGILRNSINRQWTLGAISKLNYDISDNFKTQFGLDWRTAEIEHAREVRDLLGGDYYTYTYNDFDTTPESQQKKLGDIIDYHNHNTVDWLGFFGQFEYTQNAMSLYGMAGYSTISYTYTDHFTEVLVDDTVGTGKELFLETDAIGSYQVKGGGIYKISDNIDVFGNFGYIGKPPILDAVIDDHNGVVSQDPENEKFTAYEGGLNIYSSDGKAAAKLNFYDMQWKDRTLTMNVEPGQGSSGDTDILFLTGLNQSHRGVEFEISVQPAPILRLDASISVGQWEYLEDVDGEYRDIDNDTTYYYMYSIKGLKIGDMPQTGYAFSGSLFPMKGLTIQAVLNVYSNHFADWDPLSREFDGTEATADRGQSWQAPDYHKVDLHATYDLPFSFIGTKLQAFVHVFNLTDQTYIQDAVDNSTYNAYTSNGKEHLADDAEVFFGLPRSFNAGISVRF